MSPNQLQSEPPAVEELVAYLDGELSPEECRRVEQRLAVDETYRTQLHELDHAWEALDALPQLTLRDDFVHTTIEMVALAAQNEVREGTATRVARQRRRLAGAASLGIAAAVLAFVAFQALLADENRSLVSDLPVILQGDLLAQQVDAGFLRQLSQTMPPQRLADDDEQLRRDLDRIRLVSAMSSAERGAWIEQRSPQEKAELAARASRFHAREAEEQQRLRQLAQEIATADDADLLQPTLLAYGQWLDRRTSGQRAELRALPTDERLALIQDYVARDTRRAERQLSAEDASRLRDTIFAVAQQLQPHVLEEMQERPGRRARAAFLIVVQALREERPYAQTRLRLIDSLSPSAREHLQRVRRTRRGWPDQQLIKWMYDSLQPERGADVLERFFASDRLDNDQRERLLNLPPGEMEAELERLYFADQLGMRGRQWLGDHQGTQGFNGNLPEVDRPSWSADDPPDDRPTPETTSP